MDVETTDMDEGMLDGEAPPPPPAPAPVKKATFRGPPQERGPGAEVAREDDRSTWEWLADIGSGATVRIKLERKSPREWEGHQVGGWLADFDEPFTEPEVKHRFGGGKFFVKVMRPNPKGGWMHAGSRTFEISGDPKLTMREGLKDTTPLPPMGRYAADDLSLSERAMSSMERQAISAERRARELEDEARREKPSGLDPALLKLLTDNPALRGLEARLDQMARVVADKDAKIMELVTRKPESTFQDRLLDKMVDGENVRINSLRAQHESEIRQLRQSNADDVKQLRGHSHEELQMRERAHEREISTLRESHGGQLKSTEQSYEARLDGMKGRLADLERQLTESKHELVEMRAKKEKSPVETMEELATMKNAMDALGLGGGEPEPSSMIERVLNGVMGSRLAEAVATRVENAPVAPPVAAPQPRRPMRRQAQGAPQQTAQSQARPPRAVAAPPAAPQVSPLEVAAAVAFIESAITNETPPEVFATSARSMVPESILVMLRSASIDQILAIMKPEGGSVILTQRGRNFLRQTQRHLMGGGEAEEVVAEALA
jgi:hypothetical protein